MNGPQNVSKRRELFRPKQRVLGFYACPRLSGLGMPAAAASLLRRGSPERYHDVTADAIDDRHGCKQAASIMSPVMTLHRPLWRFGNAPALERSRHSAGQGIME
jgi:hypothetical protein